MKREFKGWSRSRPVRIAFLVEEGEHAQLSLDGIYADGYKRWGGRFSLIVPCVSKRIAPAYWSWLEAYDPDIVYSYVELDEAAILEVHERVAPGEYLHHRLGSEPRLDVQGFKPDYRFNPLVSLSVIFSIARGRPQSPRVGSLKIIDSWHTESPTRLLTDNFGTYQQSFATGHYPPDASASATLLTIVSAERQQDRRFGVPQDLDMIASEREAFAAVASGKAKTLSVLSALMAPRLDLGNGVWSSAFNLVVGDTFADRVLFWNARLHIPSWLDSDLCCLRVDMAHLRDPGTLEELGAILKHRNRVNGGSGGSANLVIRSASVSVEELEEAKTLIVSTKPWCSISVERIASLNAVVPSARVFTHAHDVQQSYGISDLLRDWVEFDWRMPTAQIVLQPPMHLDDAPSRQAFATGYWFAETMFEYDGAGPRTSQNQWKLSKRWRLEGAFGVTRPEVSQRVIPPPVRRSRDGHLAVPATIMSTRVTITVPSPDAAIQYALALRGRKGTIPHGVVAPPQRVAWARPSNEARYLVGVLGMVGGLQQAASLLLHPFLRALLARLGGTTGLSAADIRPTMDRLQKQARRKPTMDLSNEGDRTVLAGMIVRAAKSVGSSHEYVPYDQLHKEWTQYRSDFWTKQPDRGDPADGIDWDELETASLDKALIFMRRRRMFFQGHAWTCPNCHHKNWADFESLKPQLPCDICARKVDAPVNLRWLFRPNEFLIESLSSHSVLSLIWILSALRYQARHSLIYVGPTAFGFTDEAESADAEADLMVLLDGRAYLCEVKSSWSALRGADIEGLVDLAKRLRPDVALLAVMETGGKAQDALAKAKADLAAVGIDFEIMTTEDFGDDDNPYLHFELGDE